MAGFHMAKDQSALLRFLFCVPRADSFRFRPHCASPTCPVKTSYSCAIFSFPNAERAEDQVQDVVVGRCAGDLIERAQSVVEIEQQHLMRNSLFDSIFRCVECGERIFDHPVMADIREKSSLCLRPIFSTEMPQNLAT